MYSMYGLRVPDYSKIVLGKIRFIVVISMKDLKVAVNTIVPRSPFFLFLYLKTQTVTHIRKNAVEYLRQ